MRSGQKGSVAIIFLVILLILSLFVAGAGFILLQKEKALRVEIEERLQDLEVKYRVAEKNLESAREETEELKRRHAIADEQLESVQEELRREVEAKEKSISELMQVRGELDQQRLLKEDLERQLAEAKSQVDKLNEQIKKLESEKSDLMERIGKEKSVRGVELGKIVVAPAVEPAEEVSPAPPVAEKVVSQQIEAKSEKVGKILVVNREYNFVVINLGRKDGINTGDILSVYRNGRNLGDISVEKVHESMSAANMLSANMKNLLKEGDRVAIKQ